MEGLKEHSIVKGGEYCLRGYKASESIMNPRRLSVATVQ